MTVSPHPHDRRGRSFIRWAAAPRHEQPPDHRPDPGFVVDRRRLDRYLSSLESLSGE